MATAFNEMAATLEQAEILRRNLLADVAHELRTPISVIQGNLQAILDDVFQLDKSEIARLFDQTRQLARLVDDLGDLAQAEAHQLPIQKLPVDMAALVSREERAPTCPWRKLPGSLSKPISRPTPPPSWAMATAWHNAWATCSPMPFATHHRWRVGHLSPRSRPGLAYPQSRGYRLRHRHRTPAPHLRSLLPHQPYPFSSLRRHWAGT